MEIRVPKLSLVVLIGPSGSGKSTFAREHFLSTEVLSSDYCRGLVSDDENSQAATDGAFEVLHYIAGKRLARGRLTVVDATNVQREARRPLVRLAREYHCLPVAIVFNLPERVCQDRNRARADRDFGRHVIAQQRSQLRRSLRGLKREGFRHVSVFETPEEVEAATVERVSLWNDKREEHGPFDVIGDVHGCCDELETLLGRLGYRPVDPVSNDAIWGGCCYRHPDGRKAVFLGDLVDRGPRNVDALRLVRNMVESGDALCVPGNHDVKFMRKLRGRDVQVKHGLERSVAEVESLDDDVRDDFAKAAAMFIDGLVSHYVLDDGRLVVAHAGMNEKMQGRGSGRVREFALYGDTTGETDEFGLPVRLNWAADYRGKASVVYGHTPVPEPEWLNSTVNVDTGCVFGGKLTGLRYPERDFVSVAARETYCEPVRPLADDATARQRSSQHVHDDVLDAEDVTGKRIVTTRLRANVTVREENAMAALEVMSRFAADPKWLIYLPPTMSPSETSQEDDHLEHPAEAFAYYRAQRIAKVICEEKHMGSRAVVVICRDGQTAHDRFGVTGDEAGIVYTRTGRRFFNDDALERQFLDRVRGALDRCDFWGRFSSDWACLDCELMPWSAKAQALLQSQYAAVGAAGRASLPKVVEALNKTAGRMDRGNAMASQPDDTSSGLPTRDLAQRYEDRRQCVDRFVEAYRQYCWTVESLDDLKLAPFHLLATEDKVHVDRDHAWHMDTLAEICRRDEKLLMATPYKVIDVTGEASLQAGIHKVIDVTGEASLQAGIQWWRDLTERGGEGMVVKPLEFIARGKRGLVQPAVKCRGREYLRIIYGPEYTAPEHLDRLRNRGLAAKRSLALREFALGIEALERFVGREPLRRVHECVFGVLALESEPVDPRL